jgi:tetratricopeptide (TPR) repeat protein
VGLEAEARDMEFLIAQAHSLMGADLKRLAVMGWSWGGLAALLVQMRNPNVDAVLSLDGAIATHEDKIRTTAFYFPQRVRVPVMLMSTSGNAPSFESFAKKIKYSERFVLDFKDVTHSDFSSYGFVARSLSSSLDEADQKKKKAYELICRYTLAFLDEFLKDDTSTKEFLRNAGAEKELLSISYEPSLPLPPTQDEFFALIRDKGVDPAYKVFQEVKNRDPDYQMFEAFEMTVLADRLYKAGREEDAIRAAKLRVEAYPNDYLSYEWVANLYYKEKAWKDALQYYTTAYEMALKLPQTEQLKNELEWYRKRIETVKGNLPPLG